MKEGSAGNAGARRSRTGPSRCLCGVREERSRTVLASPASPAAAGTWKGERESPSAWPSASRGQSGHPDDGRPSTQGPVCGLPTSAVVVRGWAPTAWLRAFAGPVRAERSGEDEKLRERASEQARARERERESSAQGHGESAARQQRDLGRAALSSALLVSASLRLCALQVASSWAQRGRVPDDSLTH